MPFLLKSQPDLISPQEMTNHPIVLPALLSVRGGRRRRSEELTNRNELQVPALRASHNLGVVRAQKKRSSFPGRYESSATSIRVLGECHHAPVSAQEETVFSASPATLFRPYI